MESGLSLAQSNSLPGAADQEGVNQLAPAEPQTAQSHTDEVPPIDIPESAIDAQVSLESFLLVLQHGEATQGDSNRFAAGSSDEEELFSLKKLEQIWSSLGGGEVGPVKFTALSQHPHIKDIIAVCYTYKLPDLSVAALSDEQ